MYKSILLSIMLTFSVISAKAQSFNQSSMDSLMDLLSTKDRWMGSVAILKDGKTIYSRAIGFADRENKIKATSQTKYRIGSISKMFTTALTMKAMEQGKLTLDTKLDKYFPQVPNASEITISMLLQHRSGIRNYTEASDYLMHNMEAVTEENQVKKIVDLGSEFKPDSKAEYSNSNFILMTFILEKIYNKDYTDLINEYITKPLKLNNTQVGGKINIADNESYSYNAQDNYIKETETDMSVPRGAGNIISTSEDICKFITAYFEGNIVTPKSIELVKEVRDGYGRGAFEFPFHDQKGYGHTGGIDGFTSVAAYFPDEKVAVAIMSNGSDFENNEIGICALSAVFGKPFEMPALNVVEVPAEKLKIYTGNYVNDEINMTISITVKGNILNAQATGQPSFPLEAIDETNFQFLPAGVKIRFLVQDKTLILRQGGGEYKFIKK